MKRSGYLNIFKSIILVCFFINGTQAQSAFPVTLSSPMDYDTIIETEPNFIWQTDINGILSDIRYSQRYVLCELQENQLKGDAIALNTPLLVLDDYQSITYSYNSSSSQLEIGHTYVWQVQIFFVGLQIDQSDVYQFTIFEPTDTLPQFYPLVSKNDRQVYQIDNGKIGLISNDLGALDLSITLEMNGSQLPVVYLNELVDGEFVSETTSEEGNNKRKFILNVESLDLEPGQYTAIWSPNSESSYVFNFEVE